MLLTMSYAGFRQKIGDLKTTHEKIWCLGYHFQNHDFYGPIQDHETVCATSFFVSKKTFTAHKEISQQTTKD